MTNKIPQTVIDFILEDTRNPDNNIKREDVPLRDRANFDRVTKFKKYSRPIVEDFNNHGFKIVHLQELRFVPEYINDETVIILSIKWLKEATNELIRDELMDIILQNSHIKKHLDVIIPLAIEQWKHTLPTERIVRVAAGNIIWRYAREKDFDQIMSFLKFVEKRDYDKVGTTDERWYFIEALGRMRKHPVVNILIKYLSDERVESSAIVALGNQKDPQVLPYLKPFLNHKYSHVRDYARRAIAKIEKAQEKKNDK